ncbi:MAG: MnhB domain-containing protein, partial [Miltoncostaeaceae bacterium]
MAGAACAGLAVVLVLAVRDLPDEAPGTLPEAVADRAAETGATNPVTAVLLGFRAYDTWLEVAVLMAAAIGVLAVVGARDVAGRAPSPHPPPPLLGWMASLVVPAAVLVGGFILWLGSSAPGGAFQAGSVLGAALLLAWLAGRPGLAGVPARALAPLLGAGTAAFLATATVPLLAGDALLEVPAGVAQALVIAVESAVTVSVAVTLPLVVMAVREP